MKIFNVISFMDPVLGGGTMDRVYQLSRQLIQKGHQCTILATSKGWNQKYIDDIRGLEAVKVHCLSERYMIPKGAGKWLDDNISRFDIVHLAGNWSPINVLAYKAARRCDVPYVFSAMGMLRVVGRSNLLKHVFGFLWTRPILRDANAVIAISPREYNEYIQLDVPKESIYFIPNGVIIDGLDKKDDRAFRERYRLDNRKIILYIGRLDPIKGVDLLVEAFSLFAKDFPEFQLLIFGNDHGGFQAEIEKKINMFHMQDGVKIFPPIFGIEKSWAYHAAELFVIPSRHDTMTIVALEAAACACPLLITDKCDFAAIGDCKGGLVVSCSAQAIADGLRSLLSNPLTLKQMGLAAQKIILENYHWNKVSDDFIRVFKDVQNSRELQ